MGDEPQELGEPELAAVVREIDEMGDCPFPAEYFTAMSSRPDLAAAVWRFTKLLLSEGQLPRSITRLMMSAISAEADCRSCAPSQTLTFGVLGLSGEEVAACRPDVGGHTDLHRTTLEFATKAAADPQSITDEDVGRLSGLGMGEGELIEAAMVVALTKLMNTWVDAYSVGSDGQDPGEVTPCHASHG